MNPLVSIIMPVFNGKDAIRRSIGSLQGQTLKAIEIIVVNDASTDGSSAILDSIAQDDDRITVVHLPANEGIHAARAEGIKRATAPWIGFLDADDSAHESMYEVLLQTCLRDDVDIAICGTRMVDPEGRVLGTKVQFDSRQTFSTDLFDRFCDWQFRSGLQWNKLYRAPLIKRHGTTKFCWRVDATEDTLVNLGCFLDASSVSVMPEVLHDYLVHPGSITNEACNALATCRLLRAFALAVEAYGNRGDNVLHGITRLYRFQLTGYPMDDPSLLRKYSADLEPAMAFLAERYPLGLAMIACDLDRNCDFKSFRAAASHWFEVSRVTGRLLLGAVRRSLSA